MSYTADQLVSIASSFEKKASESLEAIAKKKEEKKSEKGKKTEKGKKPPFWMKNKELSDSNDAKDKKDKDSKKDSKESKKDSKK